eukprot:638327-Rhodomonas_salina.2
MSRQQLDDGTDKNQVCVCVCVCACVCAWCDVHLNVASLLSSPSLLADERGRSRSHSTTTWSRTGRARTGKSCSEENRGRAVRGGVTNDGGQFALVCQERVAWGASTRAESVCACQE